MKTPKTLLIHGVVQVNDWANPRDFIVTEKYIGLRLTDSRCGGMRCTSCQSRVTQVINRVKSLETEYWWQMHYDCFWIILDHSTGDDPFVFLAEKLNLTLKEAEFHCFTKARGSSRICPDKRQKLQIEVKESMR
jgi:hypothetical protein